MSDAMAEPAESIAPTAGSLLRQAREERGLHIAALATMIRVSVGKLELLEANRLEALPDVAFARALAQTMCRALKIDAAPVLALLPMARTQHLEGIGPGLNAPFSATGTTGNGSHLQWLGRPVFWLTLGLVAATAVVYFLPASVGLPWQWAERAEMRSEGKPEANSASAVTAISAQSSASAVSTPLALQPVAASSVAPGATASPASAVQASQILQVRTASESWIEVADAQGRTLISRMVLPGETIALDGNLPLHVRVGNASATQLSFRGQPVDLIKTARDNVARLDLQ